MFVFGRSSSMSRALSISRNAPRERPVQCSPVLPRRGPPHRSNFLRRRYAGAWYHARYAEQPIRVSPGACSVVTLQSTFSFDLISTVLCLFAAGCRAGLKAYSTAGSSWVAAFSQLTKLQLWVAAFSEIFSLMQARSTVLIEASCAPSQLSSSGCRCVHCRTVI